jgi:predicted  nucleic acid-binding Zn-ribbon protein
MAVTASAEHQQALLEVQAFDTKLLQLAHKRASVPEVSLAQDLEVELGSVRMRLVAAETEASDLKLDQAKAEADVEQVAGRSARDKDRLDSGAVNSPKELESLQHEIESLAKRQAELEDVELEIMQHYEDALKAAESLRVLESEVSARLSEVSQQRDGALADIDFEVKSITDQRIQAATGLPAELTNLYDKIREDMGGVGAALLHRASCQGCHMSLDPEEIDRIRNLASDVVVRCDQCRRILVRTAESGL